MQDQSMGQTARDMTVEEAARQVILERRDLELLAKANQRNELESRIKEEQARLEQLVADRDAVADAFAVSINACELRLAALCRALTCHYEDDPDGPPPPEYIASPTLRPGDSRRYPKVPGDRMGVVGGGGVGRSD